MTATAVPAGWRPTEERRRALYTCATQPEPMGMVGNEDDAVGPVSQFDCNRFCRSRLAFPPFRLSRPPSAPSDASSASSMTRSKLNNCFHSLPYARSNAASVCRHACPRVSSWSLEKCPTNSGLKRSFRVDAHWTSLM